MNNTKDSQSVIESYKRRSNSYFANPLQPPKELFVPIPSQVKPIAHRTPFYRNQTDLIANGVGENLRGMPRPSEKETLIGHQSL